MARGVGKAGAKRLGQPSSAHHWALLCKVQISERRNGVLSKASARLLFFPGLEASNSRFTALVIQVRDVILIPPCGQL